MLLTARKFLQSKIIDAEINLRGMLRNFGLKVGAVTRPQFEARVIDLIEERGFSLGHYPGMQLVPRKIRHLQKSRCRMSGACRPYIDEPN